MGRKEFKMSKNSRIGAIVFLIVLVILSVHCLAYIQAAHNAGIHDVNLLSYVIENWIGYADPRR